MTWVMHYQDTSFLAEDVTLRTEPVTCTPADARGIPPAALLRRDRAEPSRDADLIFIAMNPVLPRYGGHMHSDST